MGFLKGKATQSGGDYEICPAGNHPGVLIGIVDLGTHWESFQGQAEKRTRKVLLVWEVDVGEDGKDARHVIGRDYNVGIDDAGNISYGQKSNIRKLLEGWRGKSYAPDEDIDLAQLHKQPCLVNVTNEKTNKGKDIARVNTVSKMPKGMKSISPQHQPFMYAVESEDAIPDDEWLPRVFGEKIVDVIQRSIEHGGTGRRSQPAANDGRPTPAEQQAEAERAF